MIENNISFKDKFIELTSNDGVLDKKELNTLRNLAKDPQIDDKSFADKVLQDLDNFQSSTKVNYSIKSANKVSKELNFVFTPTYTETEKIPARTRMEIVSNISQSDTLEETKNDDSRCVAGALLNSFLLQDGDFSTLAKKLNVEKELTFKNIHLAQENLYLYADRDGGGLSSGINYNYEQDSGKITNVTVKGEVVTAAKKLGLEIIPLIGDNIENIDQRKEQVDNFFKNYPKGTLQLGVYLDNTTGELSSVNGNSSSNHSVTIFKQNNEFYLADTGQINNGDGNNVMKLNNEQVNAFVYTSSSTVNGLVLKK